MHSIWAVPVRYAHTLSFISASPTTHAAKLWNHLIYIRFTLLARGRAFLTPYAVVLVILEDLNPGVVHTHTDWS